MTCAKCDHWDFVRFSYEPDFVGKRTVGIGHCEYFDKETAHYIDSDACWAFEERSESHDTSDQT